MWRCCGESGGVDTVMFYCCVEGHYVKNHSMSMWYWGGYCEGRIYVNNTVGGIFRRMNKCLVSAVSRNTGSENVMIEAVMVKYVV